VTDITCVCNITCVHKKQCSEQTGADDDGCNDFTGINEARCVADTVNPDKSKNGDNPTTCAE
jgi:hypothetical protein